MAQTTKRQWRRRLLGSALAVGVGLVGCGPQESSASRVGGAKPDSAEAGSALFQMPRGGKSTLSLHTLPNAACTVRPADEPAGAREHLRVYADDQGVARIHLQNTDRDIASAEVVAECTDESGARELHPISVRAVDGVAALAPEPYASAGKRVQPRLEGDPMALSAEEIAARGYPPRPDREASPHEYARWLQLVTSEPTVIEPHRVTDPSRTHGPARQNTPGTSNNWSGYVITTPSSAAQYGEVFGAWSVPQAYAESGFWYVNHSSFWVGIDGWGGPDVVQDGTDQDTETYFGFQFSSYDAWTEWYPLSSQTISNFPVNPGDEIWAWTWVGTQSNSWSPTGGWGWFEVYNASQNVVAYLSTQAPSGTTLGGHTAEWVMERPTVGGSLSSLADYSSAEMTDAWAYDYADHAHYYTSDSSYQLTMTNGSDVLSTVAPVNSMDMQFTWHNYN